MNRGLEILATNIHPRADGIEEDVVRIAASLPHGKPSEARVVDVFTFSSYRKRRQVNNYPSNRKFFEGGVLNEVASS